MLILFIILSSVIIIFESQTKGKYSAITNLDYTSYWSNKAILEDNVSNCKYAKSTYYCYEPFITNKIKQIYKQNFIETLNILNNNYCFNKELNFKFSSCDEINIEKLRESNLNKNTTYIK